MFTYLRARFEVERERTAVKGVGDKGRSRVS